ncbi:MAG: rhodanese-like domain-containing protein [Burkholderiaceae bacterium]
MSQPRARRIDVASLRGLLEAGAELALLDVREQGVHARGHPFFAVSAPLSRLELLAPALLPRAGLPVVLLDDGRIRGAADVADGDAALAERAARVLVRLGYRDLAILDGGCAAWAAAGHEVFTGINVPSKAFGEFVEHHEETPRIAPGELQAMIDAGESVLILDSRPIEEFERMNIPGAIDTPGAELAWRVHDLAPDPATTVVVNCAGRTRSIIGCQSLRNAGIANRVVALKDGTMGWELAGMQCERGSRREAPAPSAQGAARARAAAQRVADRFDVGFVDAATVQQWQADESRALYLLDVRGPAEFRAQHIVGSRNAPGGQLVQATDAYIAARAARIVLVDPEQVRAVMTASWLNQMGLPDVHVLRSEGVDGFAGWETASGATTAPVAAGALAASQAQAGPGGPAMPAVPAVPSWREIAPEELATRLADPGVAVLDLASSLRHRDRHVAGAWWGVRSRLDQARNALAALPALRELVLTADDPALARLAAPEAAALWPGIEVVVLAGGNPAWFEARLPIGTGLDRATCPTDDVWYRPYDHVTDYEHHARAYLEWEVGLVDQITRDPTIRFRRY